MDRKQKHHQDSVLSNGARDRLQCADRRERVVGDDGLENDRRAEEEEKQVAGGQVEPAPAAGQAVRDGDGRSKRGECRSRAREHPDDEGQQAEGHGDESVSARE